MRMIRVAIYGGASLALFTVAFPPWNLPTWCCCFTPLLLLWGTATGSVSRFQIAWEAFLVGFLMCWIPTGFMRAVVPTGGYYLQAGFCSFFALQMVALALAIQCFRGKPIVSSAVLLALIAMLAEFLQHQFGLAWPVTAICLSVADTPLAQWAALFSPFVVSGLLYFINFLLRPAHNKQGVAKYYGPILGLLVVLISWLGGQFIANSVELKPLSFNALLVQPHQKYSEQESWQGWIPLDQLTKKALREGGPVDLIVWPETCLSVSDEYSIRKSDDFKQTSLNNPVFTLQDFRETLLPRYQTSCLVGVPLYQQRSVSRYGLEFVEFQLFNSACLVSAEGTLLVYNKRGLVPVKEGMPIWADFAVVRNMTRLLFDWEPLLSRGEKYNTLSFTTLQNQKKELAVAICYESYLPGLPQYQQSADTEAVIHLIYDGIFSDDPAWSERLLQTCRYRAIESRKWNLCCTTWTGTAIIDPCGNVVHQLGNTPGVLRSDALTLYETTP